MSTCPQCTQVFSNRETHCPTDGAELVHDTFVTLQAPGPREESLQPGVSVGEYVVEAKLGEGGAGAVFKAVHPLIGKQVAIKVLKRNYSVNPDMVSRFVAEARAVNQIRHRNIIDIFSFGSLPDGRLYYVMELLAGKTLDRYLAERGRLAVPEALYILRGIARALDAAHGCGIAHRDLKPENVFVVLDDNDPFPKLLDFGIAKLLTEDSLVKHKTVTGAPIGTPLYMSPEQCRGRDVDHRTDIYAFGIMAYRMVTGRLPVDADEFVDIIFKHISGTPELPSKVCPELPPALDPAIMAMLEKSPDHRPASAGAAMRAMEEAALDAGLQVVPSGYSGPTPPIAPRTSMPWVAAHTPATMGSVAAPQTTDLSALSQPPANGELDQAGKRKFTILAGLGAILVGSGIAMALFMDTGPPAPVEVMPVVPAKTAIATPVAPPAQAHATPEVRLPDMEATSTSTQVAASPENAKVEAKTEAKDDEAKVDGKAPTGSAATKDVPKPKKRPTKDDLEEAF